MSSITHPHGHLGQANDDDRGQNVEPDTRFLVAALCLIVAFLIFEVVLAVIGHSLALLADAGHMLTDATGLGASLLAARLAARPARGSWTFGLRRAEILSAQGNGITLLVVAALIIFGAIQRLVTPPTVTGGIVLVVAAVGVGVNLAATWVLSKANRESLNVEGSFKHVVTDLYAFIATLIAGAVILGTGFNRADAIASLFVAVLMVLAAWSLLRQTGRILLEAAPVGVDVAAVGRTLAMQPCVEEVHDLHVWTITSGFPALAAHVLVERNADCHGIRRELEEVVSKEFGIEHTTLQVDHVGSHVTTPASLIASAREARTGS